MKDILLAEKAGFCFGVQRAVDTALKCQKDYNKIVYTLGPLIHNNDVVKYLRENKVNPIDLENIDTLGEGDVIIIRSHGVKPSVIRLLKEKKLEIVDATCPYVSNIHKKVSKYYESGYDIVIVGDKNHPEVVGINGWCNDTAIIATKGELIDENLLKNKKICLVSQTTEKQGNFNSVLEKLQSLTDELVYFNTICNATEVRQKAANELSKKVDLMVVLGGKNSSNTTKLFEICSKNCENTIHVENAGEIPDYIINLKNINNIGVTAGASTPDWIIEEAVNKMNLADNKELNEFEQLLAEYDSNVHTGKKVKGIVETITEDEAYVSIVGYKGNGLLKLRDVTLNENEDLRNLLSLGEEIITKVIKVDHKDDIVYLSKIQIDREEGLRELEEAYKSKTPVSLKVLKVVKGGVTSNFKGVSVFVPASQLDGRRVENIQDFVGKTIETLIIEFAVDKKYPKVVASRRALMPVTERPRRDDSKAFDTLEKDTIVKGVVKRITDFGAFVEVNGVDGLLHLSQISWQKINKVSDVLAIGDNIDVYILDVDKEHRKLSLSLKKLKKSPWDTVKETYNVGDIIPCEVLRFTDFGAFVRVEAGVDGLVHISKISKERVEKPSDVLAIGQKINCKILELDADSKKISLSIKDADN